MNFTHLDLFIDHAIKICPIDALWGTTVLKSYKQARFFAGKLRKAAKTHKSLGLEVLCYDDKIENYIRVIFWLNTTEDTHTSTAYIEFTVNYGGADGNRLGVTGLGEQGKEILGLERKGGMSLGRTRPYVKAVEKPKKISKKYQQAYLAVIENLVRYNGATKEAATALADYWKKIDPSVLITLNNSILYAYTK